MHNIFEKISFRVNRWILEDSRRMRIARIILELFMLPFESRKLWRKTRKLYFRIKEKMRWKFDLNKIYWDIRKFIWKYFWLIYKFPKKAFLRLRATYVPAFDLNKIYWDVRKVAYKVYRMIFKKP